ncbi:MAG: MATE family efflux transporter [Clostridia bacterium]|nr:MATE family efflux transporter [Clostridia bacterium]
MTEQEKQERKRARMLEAPAKGLICRLAVPSIISMLVTTFYNMADTFFVGKLDNTSATGAVGVVFSLMAIIQAVGFFFGHGGGNYISRKLGSGESEEAETMAITSFVWSLISGAVITVLGLLLLRPLANLLGATPTILPYAIDYMWVILLGAPLMTASLVLNNQLRFQGNAIYAMVGLCTGAVLNIALDPILIFGLDMGVMGAAVATVVSQAVSFVLLLVGCSRGDNVKLRLARFSFKGRYLAEIARGGTPSLGRQGLNSVAVMCLNNMMGAYGDPAIAAMAIVSRITMFMSSAMIGFGQGFQPVCGFSYGAAKYDRVRESFYFCLRVSAIFLIACSAVGFVVAPQLVGLFQKNDAEVLRVGALALRCQLVTLPVMSFVVMANMMLQTIGRVGSATVLATARQGLCFIPAVLVLPRIFDMWGVLVSQSVADVVALIIALPITIAVLREMRRAAKTGEILK